MIGFAIFDTALRPCAIAWRGEAVVGAALPAQDRAALLRHMERRFPGSAERSPPEVIQHAIAKVVRLLAGEPVAFDDVALSPEDAAPFERQVYEQALAIP